LSQAGGELAEWGRGEIKILPYQVGGRLLVFLMTIEFGQCRLGFYQQAVICNGWLSVEQL
ncbi:MAG TPA: hypothetical protein VN023_04650, partial [Methylovorus sp.]|nr:hypothetical protein [Methylovorus sp.]